MICPDCHGTGIDLNGFNGGSPTCENCGGCGVVYCCEANKESLIPLVNFYKEEPIAFDWGAFQRLRKSSGY
jgi:hypothetical protein